MRTAERTRVIRGTVTGAGVVTAGSADFMVTKTATGVYVIRYWPLFRGRATVSAVCEWPSAAYLTTQTFLEYAAIQTYSGAGAPADVHFNFTLTGTPA